MIKLPLKLNSSYQHPRSSTLIIFLIDCKLISIFYSNHSLVFLFRFEIFLFSFVFIDLILNISLGVPQPMMIVFVALLYGLTSNLPASLFFFLNFPLALLMFLLIWLILVFP